MEWAGMCCLSNACAFHPIVGLGFQPADLAVGWSGVESFTESMAFGLVVASLFQLWDRLLRRSK
jgi:hypothetical protein